MPRVLKHLFGILAVLLALGCSGGGCSSGCSGCGMTPLPEGFPAESRIENGGAARLTDTGLGFLKANLGTLAKTLLGSGDALTFEVPESSGSISIPILPDPGYTICPGGPDPNASPPKCTAEVDLATANLDIATAAPHNIVINGTVPLRLQNLPIDTDVGDVAIALSGNDSCPGDSQTFAQIPISVNISIESNKDTAQSFHGYSRVRILSFTVDKNAIENSVRICGGLTADILNFFKGFIIDFAYDQLIGTLTDNIEQQLCRKADPALDPSCPSGTTDVDGICRYGTTADAECASIVLGLDGHIDLGGLLASISPGTKGGLDFMLAAGGHSDAGGGLTFGDLNPVNGGGTIGFYGGSEPQPLSDCVKFSEMALPTGIPLPDELLGNTVPGWPADVPGPHFGFALSERYANYALGGVYNSGLLCIGISTETVALLNSSTLKLLIPSIATLGLQQEPQQVALMVRPGQPPSIAFGNGTSLETDPTLRVRMNEASFDFYVFSLDRFIRFMTATFDLDVPVNLTVTPDGLVPTLDKIGVNNGKISNASLLSESPEALIGALQEIIESQIGSQLGGGLSAINLNDQLASLGLTLTIPDTVEGQGSPGLRRLEKGTDGYLGIFGTLGLPTTMQAFQVETSASVGDKSVDAAGLTAATLSPGNRPRVTVLVASPHDDGSRAIEYSYRVDGSAWHPWQRRRSLDVQSPWFRLQGRHLIDVRGRVVGEPMSVDPTPAQVEVIIDAEPPRVKVGPVEDGQVTLAVHDVSGSDGALLRTRLDGGAWSEWLNADAVRTLAVGEASDIEVEAKDSEGNIGSKSQALIRGKPNAAAGCDCSVSGGDTRAPSGALWLVVAGIAGVFSRMMVRRSRKRAAVGDERAASPVANPARTRLASRAALAVAVMGLGGWSGCSCGDDEEDDGASSGDYKCEGECRALEAGLIGAYTSAAVSGSTVWVAGYLEADWSHDNQYGDLVVGTWDGTKVAWQIVDGVPSEPEVDGKYYDKNGFRGGQTEPGPDVGQWTSIAVDGAGNPAVAYYDRTNRQLKIATRAGDTWDVSVVEGVTGSDIGRYAKLTFAGDTPVVAYLVIEPGTGGATTSKIRVARNDGGAWSYEDAVVDMATPCRKAYCPSGTACVADTGMCLEALSDSSCDPACAGATACIDQGSGPACADVFDDSRIDAYPDAVGLYLSLAQLSGGTLAIGYYDRIHGNLGLATNEGGSWTTRILDGQNGETDTGDVGIGASLFVDDQGAMHLSYVDGYAESLKYLKVTGATAGAPEVIDDGLHLDGAKFDDGQHLVGDDSHIVVTGGDVHVTYQDATTGQLRYAVGTPSGDTHTWKVSAVDQPDSGFAGAFSGLVEINGQLELMNWWRKGADTIVGDVAIVPPP